MDATSPSRTALSAALMRAAHTRLDRPLLLDDAWGDRLVSDAEKAALHRRILDGAAPDTRRRFERLDSPQAVIDAALRAHPTYGGVIVRSRYAEDALADAVARGVRQYVLIGAGFDSFCVRQPSFGRDLTVFEIDHPATQALKRERLAACGATVPSNVRFVAADLAREPLADVLGRSGFSATTAAFFAWLGVTIYLPRQANLATLRGIATAAAPASELVFTYVDQRLLDGGSATMDRLRAGRSAEGEPWMSGFDPTALPGELRDLGLELIEDLAGAALAMRFGGALSAGRAGHVARARVR